MVPSSLRPWTSSQIVLRLTGSRPVVGSSRKRTLRLVDERGGEVEAALHAARVGADSAIGGIDELDPLEQRLGALADGCLRKPVERRLQPQQLAAGHQRVERRLLQGDADLAADGRRVVDDVEAGDPRRAAGRPQQRRQHPHGGRLAGPVRAEEGEDLALGDLEVDSGDGGDAALEAPLQVLDFDRRHRRGSLCGRRRRGSSGLRSPPAASDARFGRFAARAPGCRRRRPGACLDLGQPGTQARNVVRRDVFGALDASQITAKPRLPAPRPSL